MGFKLIGKLPAAAEVKAVFPLSESAAEVKRATDNELKAIARGESDRLLLITGPCSADDETAVRDYCGRLLALRGKYADKLLIIPRVFTVKPRSKGVGYKGMLHDGRLGGMAEALYSVRRLYIDILERFGMPSAYDIVYPELLGYFDDLISYAMVGARSSDDQLHRSAAAGTDVLCGIKNPMGGSLEAMLNSIAAAQSQQRLVLGSCEFEAEGNPYSHGILRGYIDARGQNIPNYGYNELLSTAKLYSGTELRNKMLLVDTNHSNSGKLHTLQREIALDVLKSRNQSPEIRALVKGFLVESYIEGGSQPEDGGVYGKSITDPCISWADTEELIAEMYKFIH